MKAKFDMRNIPVLVLLCGLVTSTSIFAKTPPTSAEQLRSELETALKAKDIRADDTRAVISLFNWDGVSDDDKGMTLTLIGDLLSEQHTLLATNVISVQLSPLSTNLQAMLIDDRNDWQGDNGRRVKFSIPALGEFDVSTPTGEKIRLPYGKKAAPFIW